MRKQKQACRFASREPEVMEADDYDYPQAEYGGASSSSGRNYSNNSNNNHGDNGYGSSTCRADGGVGGRDYDIYRPGRPGRGGIEMMDADVDMAMDGMYGEEDAYMDGAADTPDGGIFRPASDLEEFFGATGEVLGMGASKLASGAAAATAVAGKLAVGAAAEGAHLAQVGAGLVAHAAHKGASHGAEAARGLGRCEAEAAKKASHLAASAKDTAAGLHERAQNGISNLGSYLGHGVEGAMHGMDSMSRQMQEEMHHAADHAKELAQGTKTRAKHDAERLAESFAHGTEEMAYLALHGVDDVAEQVRLMEAKALSSVEHTRGRLVEGVKGAKKAASDRAGILQHMVEHHVEDAAYLALHGVDDAEAAALAAARGFQKGLKDAKHSAYDRLEHLSAEAERRHHRPHRSNDEDHERSQRNSKDATSAEVRRDSSKDSATDDIEVINLTRGLPQNLAGEAGERRLRITIVSARALPIDEGDGATVLCRCEVRGKPTKSFESSWAPVQGELMWNEQTEMSCLPTDALLFVLRAQDAAASSSKTIQLAQVTLPINEIPPRGLRKSLPLGLGGASLDVCISCLGEISAQAAAKSNAGEITQRLPDGAPGGSLTPTRRVEVSRGLVRSADTARLRLIIRSINGLAVSPACLGLQPPDFQVEVFVAGTLSERHRTGGARGRQDCLLWNSEIEIPDYLVGRQLEISLVRACASASDAAAVRPTLAQATLKAEQFVPFGFDGSLTLFTPGRGISGMLQLKVELVQDSKPKNQGPVMQETTVKFPQSVAVPQPTVTTPGMAVLPQPWQPSFRQPPLTATVVAPAVPTQVPVQIPVQVPVQIPVQGPNPGLSQSWPSLPGSAPLSPAASFLGIPSPISTATSFVGLQSPPQTPMLGGHRSPMMSMPPPQFQQQTCSVHSPAPSWQQQASMVYSPLPAGRPQGHFSGPSVSPQTLVPLNGYGQFVPGASFVPPSPSVLIF